MQVAKKTLEGPAFGESLENHQKYRKNCRRDPKRVWKDCDLWWYTKVLPRHSISKLTIAITFPCESIIISLTVLPARLWLLHLFLSRGQFIK